MISIVKLTAFDNSLVDKYPQAASLVYIECDASAAAFTVSLPAASFKHDQMIVFKKVDAGSNGITVSGTLGQLIDGSSSFALSTQWHFKCLVSNRVNWRIVGNN